MRQKDTCVEMCGAIRKGNRSFGDFFVPACGLDILIVLIMFLLFCACDILNIPRDGGEQFVISRLVVFSFAFCFRLCNIRTVCQCCVLTAEVLITIRMLSTVISLSYPKKNKRKEWVLNAN